ncbi:MAG: hypothetical protein WD009_04750 [Phycisphaeraceae bacterium]
MTEPTTILVALVFAGLAYGLVTAVLATLATHVRHEIARHDVMIQRRRREIERARQEKESS